MRKWRLLGPTYLRQKAADWFFQAGVVVEETNYREEDDLVFLTLSGYGEFYTTLTHLSNNAELIEDTEPKREAHADCNCDMRSILLGAGHSCGFVSYSQRNVIR